MSNHLMYPKIALITGITRQDGSYLVECLLEEGYEIHGILHRSSSFNTARIEHLYPDKWVRDMKTAGRSICNTELILLPLCLLICITRMIILICNEIH